MSMQSGSDVAAEFFSEADEIISRLEENLRLSEKEVGLESIIDSIYRDIHTLKGSAYLFGFEILGQIAHAMEATLEPIRRLKLPIPPRLIEAHYKGLDFISRLLAALKQNSSTPTSMTSDSTNGQGSLYSEGADLISLIAEAALASFGTDLPLSKEADLNPLFALPSPMDRQALDQQTPTPSPAKTEKPLSIPPVTTQKSSAVAPQPVISDSIATESAPSAAEQSTQIARDDSGAQAQGANADTNSTIRVSVALLDRLMNLIGEMVLVRNQVLQLASTNEDTAFLNLSQKLDLVTTELQDEVMKTRMQPVGSVLSKFHRVVRDLARDLDKQIELVLEGAETELDKTLLEAVKDPLTHIIRNACDHGLETMSERKSHGKSSTGRIFIRAQQENGQVIIEVIDDGKGLDRNRIVQKAVERGLVAADKAQLLSDRDAYMLIFAPGLSTASTVSTVSGRGVGMDVVKTNIEKIGGMVDIQSESGKRNNDSSAYSANTRNSSRARR